MKSRLCVASILAALLVPSGGIAQSSNRAFDNDSVVELTKADVDDGVILAKVNSLPCAYDVSTEQLIALKAKGVSNVVIASLVERCAGAAKAQGAAADGADPLNKRTPELYLDVGQDGAHRPCVIGPTVASDG